MTKLNITAQNALNTLVEKHHALVIAKANLEAEMKQTLTERLSAYKYDRDIALRLANDAGVPRTQLGKAIGTSNYRTVQDILAVTESTAQVRAQSTSYTLLSLDNGDWGLELFKVGVGNFSGSAVVRLEDSGDLTCVSGDLAVIPNAYRAGLAEEILATINKG